MKPKNNRDVTADTTRKILDFLLAQKVFAWRQNVMGIPIRREGVVVGYRGAGKAGIPDIVGILAPEGRFIGIEIKTGRDRLRESQEGFHSQARQCGALVFVVTSFEDFLEQWNNFKKNEKSNLQ